MAALFKIFPLLDQENGSYPQIGERQRRKDSCGSCAHDNDFVTHVAISSKNVEAC
jgi:hypothetical protein